MKPNFKEMSVPELRAYVLENRDDMEAIRALFHHPSLKWTTMSPLVTQEGMPIEENVRIAEEAIRQRSERDREKQRQRKPERVHSGKNDMTVVTQEKIAKFRSELGDLPELQETVNTLAECDWVLEDATLLIASRAGEPVEMGAPLLEDLVKTSRQYLCQPEVKSGWSDLKDVLDILKEFLPPPAPLAVACLFKLSYIGLRRLCGSAESDS